MKIKMTDDKQSDNKMTDGLLSGLEGIEDAREVQPRDQTTIDTLLEVEQKLVSKYYLKMPEITTLTDLERTETFYLDVFKFVILNLHGMKFNENDLNYYLISRMNNDFEERKAMAIGMYTGCLAHLLTDRNALQDKRTTIHVNGNGMRFEKLFAFARVVDTLIVENVVGNDICSYVGSHYGSANTVICSGINGIATLCGAAKYHGRINKAIALNCKGAAALEGIASDNGYATQAIGVDIKGDATFSACAINGYIEQIIGADLDGGMDILSELCQSKGRVDQIILAEIGKHTFLRLAGKENGNLNQVLCDDTTYVSDEILCKELLSVAEARKQHHEEQYVNRVQRAIDLARSLKDKPYKEVLRIDDEFYALRPITITYF